VIFHILLHLRLRALSHNWSPVSVLMRAWITLIQYLNFIFSHAQLIFGQTCPICSRKTRFPVVSVFNYRFPIFRFLTTEVGSVVGFSKTAVSARFSVNRPNNSKRCIKSRTFGESSFSRVYDVVLYTLIYPLSIHSNDHVDR